MDEMPKLMRQKWVSLGPLFEATSSSHSGVYLIVHEGKRKRVVYVGVSAQIGNRINQHYVAYLRGKRTFFDAGRDDDVYEIVTGFELRNHVANYRRLAKKGKVWASTTVEQKAGKNLLLPNEKFEGSWREILKEKYLPCLHAWAMPISDYTYEKACVLESAIQHRLIAAFDLR